MQPSPPTIRCAENLQQMALYLRARWNFHPNPELDIFGWGFVDQILFVHVPGF